MTVYFPKFIDVSNPDAIVYVRRRADGTPPSKVDILKAMSQHYGFWLDADDIDWPEAFETEIHHRYMLQFVEGHRLRGVTEICTYGQDTGNMLIGLQQEIDKLVSKLSRRSFDEIGLTRTLYLQMGPHFQTRIVTHYPERDYYAHFARVVCIREPHGSTYFARILIRNPDGTIEAQRYPLNP